MNYTRVFVALTALVVGGCSALPAGAGAAPDAARESAAAAATNVTSPSSAEPSEASAPAGAVGEIAAGCEPSALGALHDDGFVPIEDRRTTPVEQQIDNGLTIVESIDQLEVTAYTPLVPRTIPGGRSLQMIGVLPEIQAVSFIYAASPLDRAMTATAALRAGAIAVTQRPFEYLTADVVLSEGPRRNKWRVRFGPHDAALVWGDEMAEALRPFGLYWTDGPARVGRTRQPGTSRRAGQSGSIHLLLTQFRPLLRPQIRFVSTSPVDAARSLPGVRRLGCSERGLRRGRLSSA